MAAAYTLPDLPYPYDALEPYIDKQTMITHHTKHHAGYVVKLNTALESYTKFQQKSVEDLLKDLAACRKRSGQRCATKAADMPTTLFSGRC